MIDYIEHHGIKGQKWGKRNGPPYPLDAEDHSAEEKKKNPKIAEEIEENKEQKKAEKIFEKVKHDASVAANTLFLKRTIPIKKINSMTDEDLQKVREDLKKDLDRSVYDFKKRKPSYLGMFVLTKEQAKEKIDKMTDDELKTFLKRKRARAMAGAIMTAGKIALIGAVAYTGYKYMKGQEQKNGLDRLTWMFEDGTIDMESMTEDLTVPAGTIFQRMAGMSQEDLSKPLYAVFDKADMSWYKTVFGIAGRYQNRYEALSDIKSPSGKLRWNLFKDMMQDDEYYEKVFEHAHRLEWLQGKMTFDRGDKTLKSLYKDFVEIQGDAEKRSINGVQEYFDKIKEMGYNAVMDDNDNGRMGKSAMILLDGSNTLKLKGSHKIKLLEWMWNTAFVMKAPSNTKEDLR